MADEPLVGKKSSMQTPEEHRLEEELRKCDPERMERKEKVGQESVNRMTRELAEGFELLRKYPLAATFFGSSRCGVGDEIYDAAKALSSELAHSGFTIITGGAGGIMEAANRGAFEAGGESVGLNIRLPQEQGSNAFLTESKTFNYFFTRKVMLTFASEVYIYFPGGFGTFDELFEILTLIQTKKIKRVPVILYGRTFWDPIILLLREHVCGKFQTIDEDDLSIFTVVDSLEEANRTILNLVKC